MAVLLDEHKQWLDGNLPIVGGLVFVGTHGNDPTAGYPDSPTNLITIYSDRELTTAISNPQATDSDGRTVNKIWIADAAYSVAVWDSDDVQKYISLDKGQVSEIRAFESVVDLKTKSGTYDGQQAELAGYYAAGDGGGGKVYWDSASVEAADDGMIFQVTGVTTGRWKRPDAGSVNVKWFGAKGDGSTDDSTTIQSAATYAVVSRDKSLYFPSSTSNNYLINTAISITDDLSISAESKKVTLLCVNCGGFDFSAGVIRVTVENMGFAQSVRNTVTPNAWYALRFQGSTGSRPYWNTIKNLFIDGFGVAIETQWAWEFYVENVTTVFCGISYSTVGISANVRITSNSFSGDGISISLGDGVNTVQGYFISDNLIDGINIGSALLAKGSSFGKFTNNICDFMGATTAVLVQNGTSLPAGSFDIENNYIAFGAAGANGIRLLNSSSWGATLNKGNYINNNFIFAYPTGSLSSGILSDGTEEDGNIICNNTIEADSFDCSLSNATNTIVHDNRWLDAGFSTSVLCEYNNNIGTVITSQVLFKKTSGKVTHYYASAIPTTGSYVTGDFVENLTVSADGNNMNLIGWRRITTGSGHVLNTDWYAQYMSTVTPAT